MENAKLNSRIEKLKKIAESNIAHGKLTKSIAALNVAGYLLYNANQMYRDDDLEKAISLISNHFLRKDFRVSKNDNKAYKSEKTLIFYDGFGLDSRGLAIQYLKALLDSNYSVLYITKSAARGAQPVLGKNLSKYLENKKLKVIFKDIDTNPIGFINDFHKIVKQYSVEKAIFYSLPYDIAGIVAFQSLETVKRFFVNLTDHAFWLGVNCCDYYIEFRDYGARISYNHRNISTDQIVVQPYYPFVDQTIEFSGFPFNLDSKRLVFSGGSLYKTLGDPELYYYRIIRYILKKYKDVIFYFVGNGDTSQLDLLKVEFPGRVFHSLERCDFFNIYKYSYIYLNTYPMVGGLMMQYAALFGKIPLTLKHGSDGDNILYNQNKLGIEFTDYTSLIREIDLLFTSEEYKNQVEQNLKKSIPDEDSFRENLIEIIETGNSRYQPDLSDIDTRKFREESMNRFKYNVMNINSLQRKAALPIAKYFPMDMIKCITLKTIGLIKNGL